MTKTKIKLTQEQAKAIRKYLGYSKNDIANLLNTHAINNSSWIGEFEALNDLSQADLARALLIGYEVEPEFEVGDWVKGKFSREICKVTRVEGVKVWGHWGGRDTEQWNPAKVVTHATHEEIMQEKDRQKFASIGRKPGEIKEGDIGENNTGTLIFSKSEIEAAYKHDALKGLFPIEKFVCFWGDGND